MKTLILVLVCLLSQVCMAQSAKKTGCVSGDCNNGLGLYVWKSGNSHRGYFKNGKQHGKGIFEDKKGNKMYGNWENGVRNGKAKIVSKKGRIMYCTYVNGKRHGESKVTDENGNLIATSNWNNGKLISTSKITEETHLKDKNTKSGEVSSSLAGQGIFILDNAGNYHSLQGENALHAHHARFSLRVFWNFPERYFTVDPTVIEVPSVNKIIMKGDAFGDDVASNTELIHMHKIDLDINGTYFQDYNNIWDSGIAFIQRTDAKSNEISERISRRKIKANHHEISLARNLNPNTIYSIWNGTSFYKFKIAK